MLSQMETTDWIRIAIPFIAFVLGLLSTLLVQFLRRERSIVAWGVISEDTVFSQDVASGIKLPVQILVDNQPHDALTSVALRFGSRGNQTVEDITFAVTFNPNANILRVRHANNLGEYQKTIKMVKSKGRIEFKFKFINTEHKTIDIDILFANYVANSINVDIAKAGVTLQRRDVTEWDLSPSIFQGWALSLMGVRYDPAVSPLSEIANELKSIRGYLANTTDTDKETANEVAVETTKETETEKIAK